MFFVEIKANIIISHAHTHAHTNKIYIKWNIFLYFFFHIILLLYFVFFCVCVLFGSVWLTKWKISFVAFIYSFLICCGIIIVFTFTSSSSLCDSISKLIDRSIRPSIKKIQNDTIIFKKKKKKQKFRFLFLRIFHFVCLFVNFNNYNNNLNTKRLANSIIIIWLSILFLIKKLELFIYLQNT